MSQESRPDTVARIVIALGEAFVRKITETTINAYRIGLDGLSEPELQRAAKQALQRCKFMPSPAELRELAGHKADADQALAAWGVVLRSVPLGPYRHVDFVDRIINATIRNMGGWPGLLDRLGGSDEEKWVRQEFCKCYASFHRSGIDGDACRPLSGLSEATSIGGEVVAPRVHRIGNTGAVRIGPPKPREAGTMGIGFRAVEDAR